ncbi:hypothetical protein LLS1_12980 [Leifsonia sp. LS1]|uniref:hypothetical protein n=1 Tax=Leifsonia sp. LS1 TaxID=2828483 RepID=UPI001CFD86B0|nr:hypothetical protein [Leifsonia sp. LS1]GIT79629.1 hypothetical protein LLS1_12980 [Leifsonia sp. LS1]
MTDRSLLPDDTRFEELRDRLLDTIATDDRRRTRRHRLAAIGIAGVLVAGTTAGGIAIARASQGEINDTVECYGTADLNGPSFTSAWQPGDLEATTPTPLEQRIALAEDQCAAGWRIGSFRPQGSSSDADEPVPALKACQLPDGRLAVFPSERAVADLCARLGLSLPTP